MMEIMTMVMMVMVNDEPLRRVCQRDNIPTSSFYRTNIVKMMTLKVIGVMILMMVIKWMKMMKMTVTMYVMMVIENDEALRRGCQRDNIPTSSFAEQIYW